MFRTAINCLCCLLFAFSVSGINMTILAPTSVFVNESFIVEIKSAQLSAPDKYDTKIFIKEIGASERSSTMLSQIYYEGWKNPFFYINSSFPYQNSYELRATILEENTELCAKLRDTANKKIKAFICQPITIEQKISPEKQVTFTEQQPPDKEDISQKKSSSSEIKEVGFPIEFQEPQRIVLSSEIASGSGAMLTKEEKIMRATMISFLIFFVIIVLLILFRKL